ncbi:MAG: hypothetical protein JXQ29_04305 [Planctomycetes bacterium]|nr:hypothetical protein [Planctomycetota bacterium]
MKRLAVLFAAVLGLASSAGADPVLTLAAAFPVVGSQQVVRLEGAAEPGALRLKVVYRPNSATVREVVVGGFDAAGTIRWHPEAPGITLLIAETAGGESVCQKRVAVCFASTPVSGIIVMVLAGLLLFGGASISLVLALRGKREPAGS